MAGFPGFFSDKDPDVFVVTELTEDGKRFTPPTKENPIYYDGRNLGFEDFSLAMAGEEKPMSETEVGIMVAKLLAKQGYLATRPGKPATIYLVLSYGTLHQTSGPKLQANGSVLKFLGGDKYDLMWESESMPMLGPQVLMRGMRSGSALQIMDASSESLFIASIKAFNYEDLTKRDKTTLLWQTRMACISRGLALNESIRLLYEVGAPQVGRETDKPVIISKSDFRKTHVHIGESTVTGQWDPETTQAKPPAQAKPASKR